MIVLIDNYDSFTYNLVQILAPLDQEVIVYRNDEIDIKEIQSMRPSSLVISPGPCTPDKAGASIEDVRFFGGLIPVLGVCLGHQAFAVAYGGEGVQAEKSISGKDTV